MPDLGNRPRSIRMSQTSAARPVLGAVASATSGSAGRRVYDLAEGQIVDAVIPAHVTSGLAQAKSELTKYPPTRGTPALVESVRQYLARTQGLAYTPTQIIVSNGAKQCLYLALQAILDPGDEVVVFEPYWVSYPHQVRLAGAEPRFVPVASTVLRPDLESVERAIGPRTRAIIVNSPSNPAGTVWQQSELEQVAALAREHDLWLISDEVYDRIAFDGRQHRSLAAVNEDAFNRTVVINSASKSLAMPGIRVGFAAGPDALIDAMVRQQSHLSSGINYAGQVLAAAALSGPGEWLEALLASLQARRDAAAAALAGMRRLSFDEVEGGIYFFPRVESSPSGSRAEGTSPASRLAEEFKKELGIAVVPGDGFGMRDRIRLNFAIPHADLEEVVNLLLTWDAKS